MDQYQFEIIRNHVIALDKLQVEDDYTYLYVFHADKIPPHLGIVAHGMFYSVKAKGVDIDLSVGKIHALIKHKKICTLIFEIDAPLQQEIRDIFLTVGGQISNGETCLNPISIAYYPQIIHRKIGELLSDLNRDKAIHKVYGAYLPKDFKGILNYSVEDINRRIKSLQQ